VKTLVSIFCVLLIAMYLVSFKLHRGYLINPPTDATAIVTHADWAEGTALCASSGGLQGIRVTAYKAEMSRIHKLVVCESGTVRQLN
jgi:hypothetical protein